MTDDEGRAPGRTDKLLLGVLLAVLANGGAQIASRPASAAQVEEVGEGVRRLVTMHDRTDSDGVYLWYVPRSWGDVQRETLDHLRKLGFGQVEEIRLLGELVQQREKDE